MNKSILGLAISTIFMVGAAQATVNPNDVSATLNVTGSVTHNVTCSVNLSTPSVVLTADLDKMPTQGDGNVDGATIVDLTLSGEGCSDMATDGKIAYTFTGTADSADGTALANTLSTGDAAQGVGIALYNTGAGNSLIRVNRDNVTAVAAPSSNKLGLTLVKLKEQTAKAGAVQGSVTIQIERL